MLNFNISEVVYCSSVMTIVMTNTCSRTAAVCGSRQKYEETATEIKLNFYQRCLHKVLCTLQDNFKHWSHFTNNNIVDHVSLLFVGDISFSGPVKYYVERKHHTYNDTFNEVAPYIRQADISIGNLECPFVDKDVYPHKFKDQRRLIILDSSPKAASALR